MINKNFLGLVCTLLFFGCTRALSAEPPICSNDQPVAQWSFCRGVYSLSIGDNYYGEFYQGSFHGLGRYTTREGSKFVGQFAQGTRNGYGIEYASTGQVVRQGLWRGSFVGEEVVDLMLFPRVGELPFEAVKRWAVSDPKRRPVSQDDVFRLERDLAAAKEKIKTLEAELERTRGSSKNPGSNSGPSLVNRCLQKGFRPGTREFSECIASEGAIP